MSGGMSVLIVVVVVLVEFFVEFFIVEDMEWLWVVVVVLGGVFVCVDWFVDVVLEEVCVVIMSWGVGFFDEVVFVMLLKLEIVVYIGVMIKFFVIDVLFDCGVCVM